MALVHGSQVKLFALSANRELGEEIAQYLGLELSECYTVRFADGEIMVDIKETVRGHDVFVVQPTTSPVNESYMELLILIDALRRASAKTINANGGILENEVEDMDILTKSGIVQRYWINLE